MNRLAPCLTILAVLAAPFFFPPLAALIIGLELITGAAIYVALMIAVFSTSPTNFNRFLSFLGVLTGHDSTPYLIPVPVAMLPSFDIPREEA